MPFFEMTSSECRSITSASFTRMGVRERGDIQRLLRTQIDVLGMCLLMERVEEMRKLFKED